MKLTSVRCGVGRGAMAAGERFSRGRSDLIFRLEAVSNGSEASIADGDE